MRPVHLALVLLAFPFAAFAQPALLDQIGAAVDRGKLHVDVALQEGRIVAAPGWALEVDGAPTVTLVADAADGRVRTLDVGVEGGTLLVDGSWLRPDVIVEGLHFEDGKGVTSTRFRGRGAWRPLIAIFRPL